jgi:hypothetical protein
MLKKILHRLRHALLLVPLLSIAVAARAHHSAIAYDLKRDVRIEGTVEEYLWTNPHSWLKVRTIEPDGSERIWNIEFGTPSLSIRTGWSPATFKPGDKATFIFHPRIDGVLSGVLAIAILENGKTLRGSTPPAMPVPELAPSPGSGPSQP